MPNYVFEGELSYRGRVIIWADNMEEAQKYAQKSLFNEVIDIDPDASDMTFTWDGQEGAEED